MKKVFSLISLFALSLSLANTAFADFKLRQQITMSARNESFMQERVIWAKGARERTENKFTDERIAQMIPQIAEIRQCDYAKT